MTEPTDPADAKFQDDIPITDRPPVNYKTRPATPRSTSYRPPSTVTLSTPMTSTVGNGGWGPPPRRGMGAGGYALLGGGILLFLLGAPVAFSATSLFVCTFFTGVMVIGAVSVIAAVVIAGLR